MSQHPMFRGEEQHLVPAGLRGYRAWRLGPQGLISTNQPYAWKVTNEATCMAVSAVNRGCGMPGCSLCGGSRITAMRPEDHPAPRASCGCGFYGWYSLEDTRIVQGDVVGVFEGSGKVVMGGHGFRAERARLLGCIITPAVRALPDFLDRYAGGEMLWASDREELLRAFPPDDVSGLISHTCDARCREQEAMAQMYGALSTAASRSMKALSFQAASVGQMMDQLRQDLNQALADGLSPMERVLDRRRRRSTGPDRKPWWWRR